MSTEWSTIPACPSLMCFFNRGNTEEANSSKILCLMFVYVFILCKFVSGLILWGFFFDNLWFDDLCAEKTADKFNIVFGPDVILCG